MAENIFQDPRLNSRAAVFMIAAYEKLFQVPEAERLACRSGNRPDDYTYRAGATEAALLQAYEKAFAIQEWHDDFTETPEEFFKTYDRTEKRARANLVRLSVRVGDEVACVPDRPFGTDGRPLPLRSETIDWIDPETDLCIVKSARDERHIPLWNVLAKHTDSPGASAFGINQMELLYLADESEAHPYMLEAQKLRDDIEHSGAVMAEAIAQTKLNAILAADYPADFSNRLLVGIHLSHDRGLEMSDFRGAVLHDCTFSHCKFDNSHFEGADLSDTRFVRCKMEYCHFEGARMENADFDQCALVGSTGMNGDTRKQSEVVFDDNMGIIRGVNMDLAPGWRQFIREHTGPDEEAYDQMLWDLQEQFHAADDAYPGMGAEIFNSGARFLPRELPGAANCVAQGNNVEAARQLAALGAFTGAEPLPEKQMFVLPHSDVQNNLLAVRAFTAQIRGIPGVDMGKMTDWLDYAWDMGDGHGESYRQLLREYGEAFEQIGQGDAEAAAAMFNYPAAYLPREMHTAAEWVGSGASPEEAYEACKAQAELSGIHRKHALWREGHPDGARADFTGRTLKNLDFTGMAFGRALFTDARLENCWMNGAGFALCDFTGAAFLDVSATGADFDSAVFDGASLVSSDFSDADFEGASFVGVDAHDCEGLEGQSFGPAMTM
jgi:uncharacterized protein YjbI with pentapeptide repeats